MSCNLTLPTPMSHPLESLRCSRNQRRGGGSGGEWGERHPSRRQSDIFPDVRVTSFQTSQRSLCRAQRTRESDIFPDVGVTSFLTSE